MALLYKMQKLKIENISSFTNDSAYKNYVINKFFEDNVLQKQYYPYQFDGWKDKKLYGLVNNKGEAIYPKNIALLNYTDNGNAQVNLTFVVDALKDMQAYHRSLLSNNKLSKEGSIYTNLNVSKSTNFLDRSYINDVNNLYGLFKSFFLLPSRVQKINSIDSFFKEFNNFLRIILKISPITRSQFIKSKMASIDVSGLVIYFDNNQAFTNTEAKINKFIGDKNFDIFLDSARRFGFYVDRNVPWRIIADLESPVMASYYNNYGFYSVDEVHQKYYNVAYLEDLDVLINIICGFWNAFVTDYAFTTSFKEIPNCANMFVERSALQEITPDIFRNSYGIIWQLRFYLYCRTLESNLGINQNKFENILLESLKIQKYNSTQQALAYINTTIEELKVPLSQNLGLTTPDELANFIVKQQQQLPVQGINF
jgi:hypothetical protein